LEKKHEDGETKAEGETKTENCGGDCEDFDCRKKIEVHLHKNFVDFEKSDSIVNKRSVF